MSPVLRQLVRRGAEAPARHHTVQGLHVSVIKRILMMMMVMDRAQAGQDEKLRAVTRRTLKRRAVTIGTVLNLRTTTSQKCAAVPRRARI